MAEMLKFYNTYVVPGTTASYDIGSTTYKFKDLYLSGDINAGGDLNLTGDANITGGASIGGNLALTGNLSVNNLTASGNITGNGFYYNVKLIEDTSSHYDYYTLLTTDDIIVCDSSINFTIYLPEATGSGKVYYIKSIGTGIIKVDTISLEYLDGESYQNVHQYECLQIADVGAGVWIII